MSKNHEAIVMTASAKMPSSCWGRYGKVGLVIVDRDELPVGEPAMISERAIGVVEIIEVWDRLNMGTTDRCAFAKAKIAAGRRAEMINAAIAKEA